MRKCLNGWFGVGAAGVVQAMVAVHPWSSWHWSSPARLAPSVRAVSSSHRKPLSRSTMRSVHEHPIAPRSAIGSGTNRASHCIAQA
jgi:hypothetical protein